MSDPTTAANKTMPTDPAKMIEEVKRLRLTIERDRTAYTNGLNAIRSEIESRRGMAESRGSYEWDDDKYRQEFGWALDAIADRVKFAEEVSHAHDLRDSAENASEVIAARNPYKRIDELSAALAASEEQRELAKDILANLLQDLDYAVDREHFGAPTDCIPKSSIEQSIGAARGQYAEGKAAALPNPPTEAK